MKIAIAQICPIRGDIIQNVSLHRLYAEAARTRQAQLIVFPELSLTGYEPSLARDLATSADDLRLRELQYVCDRRGIAIAAGLPTRSELGVHISMIIFQPGQMRITYSKQLLHPDEGSVFAAGKKSVCITLAGRKIVPGICYETLRAEHAQQAAEQHADVYLASLAKPSYGIEKGRVHYPAIAMTHNMAVVMSNAVGSCDNFTAAGSSAAWSAGGALLGQLGETEEGMLVVDLSSNTAVSLDGNFCEIVPQLA